MENLFINNTMILATAEEAKKEKEMQVKMANSSKETVVSSETTQEAVTETSEVAVDEATATDTAVEGETLTEEAAGDIAVEDTAAVEGEVVTDEAATDTATAAEGEVIIDDGTMPIYDEGGMGEGTYVDPTMGVGATEIKDPLLSSWLFVIGISVAVLCVSVVLGVLLARRKIKKGIELYED